MSTFRIWYRSQPVALRTLLAVNVVFYLAWVVLLGNIPTARGFVINHVALNPALPGVLLEAWQLVTYNFLHFGFLHVLFNMLWMWWIGKEYEELHGPHQMLALYILCGVGGGVLTVAGYAVMNAAPYVIGASASVMGLMAAVATLYPYKKIGLLFIGSVRLVYVVVGLLALDLLFAAGSGVAVLAHLGGAATGFLFAKGERSGMDLTSWAKVFFSKSSRSGGSYAPGRSARSSGGSVFGSLFGGGSASGGGGRTPSERETLREERDRKRRRQSARREEVDRILDKISEDGYDSLSEDEKRTLEDASRQ